MSFGNRIRQRSDECRTVVVPITTRRLDPSGTQDVFSNSAVSGKFTIQKGSPSQFVASGPIIPPIHSSITEKRFAATEMMMNLM